MATKPALLPVVFSGDGSWDDWLTHFNDVAVVNGWDDANKLKWLKVRLTGRAQRAFKRMPDEKKEDFATVTAIKLLEDRFEPPSKKELYVAEFQSYHKKSNEELAENLRVLSEKAHRDLGENAKVLPSAQPIFEIAKQPSYCFGGASAKDFRRGCNRILEVESYVSQCSTKIATVIVSDEDQMEQDQEGVRAVGKEDLYWCTKEYSR